MEIRKRVFTELGRDSAKRELRSSLRKQSRAASRSGP